MNNIGAHRRAAKDKWQTCARRGEVKENRGEERLASQRNRGSRICLFLQRDCRITTEQMPRDADMTTSESSRRRDQIWGGCGGNIWPPRLLTRKNLWPLTRCLGKSVLKTHAHIRHSIIYKPSGLGWGSGGDTFVAKELRWRPSSINVEAAAINIFLSAHAPCWKYIQGDFKLHVLIPYLLRQPSMPTTPPPTLSPSPYSSPSYFFFFSHTAEMGFEHLEFTRRATSLEEQKFLFRSSRLV